MIEEIKVNFTNKLIRKVKRTLNLNSEKKTVFKQDYEYNYDYAIKNRRLKIEEYNDDGDLIDIIELTSNDLWNFYQCRDNLTNRDIARRREREYFKGKELELAEKLAYYLSNGSEKCYWNNRLIEKITEIFKSYRIEAIEFVVNFLERDGSIEMDNYETSKSNGLFDILKWTTEVDGIYYSTDNTGRRVTVFFDKPTLKQAKYEKQNNGREIVFLSFRNWQKYIINDRDLI